VGRRWGGGGLPGEERQQVAGIGLVEDAVVGRTRRRVEPALADGGATPVEPALRHHLEAGCLGLVAQLPERVLDFVIRVDELVLPEPGEAAIRGVEGEVATGPQDRRDVPEDLVALGPADVLDGLAAVDEVDRRVLDERQVDRRPALVGHAPAFRWAARNCSEW